MYIEHGVNSTSTTPQEIMSHLPFSSKFGRVNGCSRSALKISGISELMFSTSFGCKVQQERCRADSWEKRRPRWNEINSALKDAAGPNGFCGGPSGPDKLLRLSKLDQDTVTTTDSKLLNEPAPLDSRTANQQPSFERQQTEGESTGWQAHPSQQLQPMQGQDSII